LNNVFFINRQKTELFFDSKDVFTHNAVKKGFLKVGRKSDFCRIGHICRLKNL